MENKKLLKFLLKDIAEIEELFTDKGNSGFDDFEMEFIRSRFEGARKIIHFLNENNDSVAVEPETRETTEEKPGAEVATQIQDTKEEVIHEEQEPVLESSSATGPEAMEPHVAAMVGDQQETQLEKEEVQDIENTSLQEDVEPVQDEDDLEEEIHEEPQRIGDRAIKEKSLNDIHSNGSNKLENKLSNSPVSSLQGAIGINDRYIYIRELFDGSAESFSKAVAELDRLQNIREAVAYLQQNYKWKKNDTSLKFVNLVKRRFPNG